MAATSETSGAHARAPGEVYRRIEVRRFAPALGAEVRGVDLAEGIDDATYREIRRAFLEHQVLFFKEQRELPPAAQVAIGKRFGELHFHPAAPSMPGGIMLPSSSGGCAVAAGYGVNLKLMAGAGLKLTLLILATLIVAGYALATFWPGFGVA
jgi:hypothetical protein